MSVDPASLPQPGFYTYAPSMPTGIARGSAWSTLSTSPDGTSSASSASSSSSASSAPAASAQSPYQAAYASLTQQDDEELLNVSLGSPQNAQANVASVLAQAAALQAQQQASQQQAAASAASSVRISAPSVPSYTSIVQQSDGNANSDLSNGTLGASIDTTA